MTYNYNVTTLWIIYIIVVIAIFLLFWAFISNIKEKYSTFGYGSILFIATICGAIAVLIGTAWLNPVQMSSNDTTSLSILYIVSFSLPMLVVFYIVWMGEYASFTGENCCSDGCQKPGCPRKNCNPGCRTEKLIECNNNTGICQLKEQTMYREHDITKVIYTNI